MTANFGYTFNNSRPFHSEIRIETRKFILGAFSPRYSRPFHSEIRIETTGEYGVFQDEGVFQTIPFRN